MDSRRGWGGCCACLRGRRCCSRRNRNKTKIEPQDPPRCHLGMYNAFLPTVPDIDKYLMPHLYDEVPKRVIVTGHSLGGALATAAMAHLFHEFDFNASSHSLHFVTIGSARFGNA